MIIMKERLCLSVLFSGFVLVALSTVTIADIQTRSHQDICRFFPNNTRIRDPESCNKYIDCIDFVSHYSQCSGSTPFFNKDDAKCVKTLSQDAFCHVSCVNSTGKFIPDPISCTGYYYCYNEETSTQGKCPGTLHFNATLQSCIYKENSDCVVEKFNFCQLVKDNVAILNEKSCKQYFICTKGSQSSKQCKSDEYYNAVTGKCGKKDVVKCLEHPVPKEACGTERKPKKNVFVEDDATCNGYFYCAEQADGTPDANPKWNKCPPNLFFSASKQACVHPLDVECSWDRCQGRSLTFVTSETTGCRHYLRCRDGVKVEELTCGNLFFDERQGVCTNKIISETACKG